MVSRAGLRLGASLVLALALIPAPCHGDESPAVVKAVSERTEPSELMPSWPARLGVAHTCFHGMESLLLQTYYVSTTGNDLNPGTLDSPWRTIQHSADSVEPGDVVLVRSGTYVESVSLSASGTEGEPISFGAAPGEEVDLHGDITLSQGVSHVSISGFNLSGYSVWGLSLFGDNHHVTLSGLDISGGDAGIHFTVGNSGESPWYGPVGDITLADTTVRDCTYTAVDCTPGPCDRMTFRNLEICGSGLEAGFGGDGLAVERGQHLTVECCYIHDNGGDGIDLNSRDWGGNVAGIVVRRNRVVRNHLTGVKLWAGGRVENNLIAGQGLLPVMLGAFPSTYQVLNNTIAYNMYDPSYGVRNYAFLVGYPNDETGISAPVTLTLVNNIWAFNTGPSVGGPTGLYLGENVTLTEHHNLYWSRDDGEIQAEFIDGRDAWFSRAEIGNSTWTNWTGQGQADLTSDPLFVSDWPGVDLRLQPGSPAVDAGSTGLAPNVDLEGNPRALGGAPDIGAYEYDAGIELEEGWNLISLPRTPPDTAIATVLSPISGSYDLVFAYDASEEANPWLKHCPDAPPFAGELMHVDEAMGLWIRCTSADILPLAGTAPGSVEIPLREGWNLVGYPYPTTRAPSDAFSSISSQLVDVWTYVTTDPGDPWKLYSPGAPPGINDLDAMAPERGYWVRVSSDCTWALPSD